MKSKEVLLGFRNTVLVLLIAVVTGFVLMTLVYCIPVDNMKSNVFESLQFLRGHEDVEEGNRVNFYDTKTNIIDLYEAVYPTAKGDVIKDAMGTPTANYMPWWGGDWVDGLQEVIYDDEYTVSSRTEYGRYWHGYLVILKPLLFFFNLSDIYRLNFLLQSILVIWIIIKMYKEVGAYVFAYVAWLMFMNPLYIVQSFQLSSVYYVINITLLLLIYLGNNNLRRILTIFCIDGVLVAFFDFLTYPMVAFAIPALFCSVLIHSDSIKKEILLFLGKGTAFFVGYAGMWVSKWMLATIFTEDNIFKDGFESFLHRTGGFALEFDKKTAIEITPLQSIIVNLKTFIDPVHIVMIILLLLVSVVMIVCIVMKKYSFGFDKSLFATILLTAIMPFVWLGLIYNHCVMHPHLEWRVYSILIFVFAVFMCNICRELFVKRGKYNE